MASRKYLILQNYFRFVRNVFGLHNLVIDRLAVPVSFDDLGQLQGVELAHFDMHGDAHTRWVRHYYPEWRERFGHPMHKKLLEFSISFALLAPQPDDVVIDAAGGQYTYLSNLECKKAYLQDLVITRELKSRLGDKIEYVEGDAGDIQLPDESVDKISCHHAFEHFRTGSDSAFVKEVQRLLRPAGKCCIVPTFIASQYVEVTNAFAFDRKYDSRSRRVIDPTATIPGGGQAGYARIYDLEAFQERVIDNIDLSAFKVWLLEVRMDGNTVPDLTLDCHQRITAINNPFRALLIERLQ